MKIKKKILALVLTAVIGTSIVGCGKKETKSSDDANKAKTESTQKSDTKSELTSSQKIDAIVKDLNVKATDATADEAKYLGFKNGAKKVTYKGKLYVIGESKYSDLTSAEKVQMDQLKKTHTVKVGETAIGGYYNSDILIFDTTGATTIEPTIITAMDKIK